MISSMMLLFKGVTIVIVLSVLLLLFCDIVVAFFFDVFLASVLGRFFGSSAAIPTLLLRTIVLGIPPISIEVVVFLAEPNLRPPERGDLTDSIFIMLGLIRACPVARDRGVDRGRLDGESKLMLAVAVLGGRLPFFFFFPVTDFFVEPRVELTVKLVFSALLELLRVGSLTDGVSRLPIIDASSSLTTLRRSSLAVSTSSEACQTRFEFIVVVL